MAPPPGASVGDSSHAAPGNDAASPSPSSSAVSADPPSAGHVASSMKRLEFVIVGSKSLPTRAAFCGDAALVVEGDETETRLGLLDCKQLPHPADDLGASSQGLLNQRVAHPSHARFGFLHAAHETFVVGVARDPVWLPLGWGEQESLASLAQLGRGDVAEKRSLSRTESSDSVESSASSVATDDESVASKEKESLAPLPLPDASAANNEESAAKPIKVETATQGGESTSAAEEDGKAAEDAEEEDEADDEEEMAHLPPPSPMHKADELESKVSIAVAMPNVTPSDELSRRASLQYIPSNVLSRFPTLDLGAMARAGYYFRNGYVTQHTTNESWLIEDGEILRRIHQARERGSLDTAELLRRELDLAERENNVTARERLRQRLTRHQDVAAHSDWSALDSTNDVVLVARHSELSLYDVPRLLLRSRLRRSRRIPVEMPGQRILHARVMQPSPNKRLGSKPWMQEGVVVVVNRGQGSGSYVVLRDEAPPKGASATSLAAVPLRSNGAADLQASGASAASAPSAEADTVTSSQTAGASTPSPTESLVSSALRVEPNDITNIEAAIGDIVALNWLNPLASLPSDRFIVLARRTDTTQDVKGLRSSWGTFVCIKPYQPIPKEGLCPLHSQAASIDSAIPAGSYSNGENIAGIGHYWVPSYDVYVVSPVKSVLRPTSISPSKDAEVLLLIQDVDSQAVNLKRYRSHSRTREEKEMDKMHPRSDSLLSSEEAKRIDGRFMIRVSARLFVFSGPEGLLTLALHEETDVRRSAYSLRLGLPLEESTIVDVASTSSNMVVVLLSDATLVCVRFKLDGTVEPDAFPVKRVKSNAPSTLVKTRTPLKLAVTHCTTFYEQLTTAYVYWSTGEVSATDVTEEHGNDLGPTKKSEYTIFASSGVTRVALQQVLEPPPQLPIALQKSNSVTSLMGGSTTGGLLNSSQDEIAETSSDFQMREGDDMMMRQESPQPLSELGMPAPPPPMAITSSLVSKPSPQTLATSQPSALPQGDETFQLVIRSEQASLRCVRFVARRLSNPASGYEPVSTCFLDPTSNGSILVQSTRETASHRLRLTPSDPTSHWSGSITEVVVSNASDASMNCRVAYLLSDDSAVHMASVRIDSHQVTRIPGTDARLRSLVLRVDSEAASPGYFTVRVNSVPITAHFAQISANCTERTQNASAAELLAMFVLAPEASRSENRTALTCLMNSLPYDNLLTIENVQGFLYQQFIVRGDDPVSCTLAFGLLMSSSEEIIKQASLSAFQLLESACKKGSPGVARLIDLISTRKNDMPIEGVLSLILRLDTLMRENEIPLVSALRNLLDSNSFWTWFQEVPVANVFETTLLFPSRLKLITKASVLADSLTQFDVKSNWVAPFSMPGTEFLENKTYLDLDFRAPTASSKSSVVVEIDLGKVESISSIQTLATWTPSESEYLSQTVAVESWLTSPSTMAPEETAPMLYAVSGDVTLDADDVLSFASQFPTVAPRHVCITSGCYYYEVLLIKTSDGVAQIGWCDSMFGGDNKSATGAGDDEHSWSYDGHRVKKWCNGQTSWGRKWKDGDVVGCAISLRTGQVMFSLNGSWKKPMGLAFDNVRFEGGVYPGITGERSFRCKVNLGSQPFRFQPPGSEFRSVASWYKTSTHKLLGAAHMRTWAVVPLKSRSAVGQSTHDGLAWSLSDMQGSQFSSTPSTSDNQANSEREKEWQAALNPGVAARYLRITVLTSRKKSHSVSATPLSSLQETQQHDEEEVTAFQSAMPFTLNIFVNGVQGREASSSAGDLHARCMRLLSDATRVHAKKARAREHLMLAAERFHSEISFPSVEQNSNVLWNASEFMTASDLRYRIKASKTGSSNSANGNPLIPFCTWCLDCIEEYEDAAKSVRVVEDQLLSLQDALAVAPGGVALIERQKEARLAASMSRSNGNFLQKDSSEDVNLILVQEAAVKLAELASSWLGSHPDVKLRTLDDPARLIVRIGSMLYCKYYTSSAQLSSIAELCSKIVQASSLYDVADPAVTSKLEGERLASIVLAFAEERDTDAHPEELIHGMTLMRYILSQVSEMSVVMAAMKKLIAIASDLMTPTTNHKENVVASIHNVLVFAIEGVWRTDVKRFIDWHAFQPSAREMFETVFSTLVESKRDWANEAPLVLVSSLKLCYALAIRNDTLVEQGELDFGPLDLINESALKTLLVWYAAPRSLMEPSMNIVEFFRRLVCLTNATRHASLVRFRAKLFSLLLGADDLNDRALAFALELVRAAIDPNKPVWNETPSSSSPWGIVDINWYVSPDRTVLPSWRLDNYAYGAILQESRPRLTLSETTALPRLLLEKLVPMSMNSEKSKLNVILPSNTACVLTLRCLCDTAHAEWSTQETYEAEALAFTTKLIDALFQTEGNTALALQMEGDLSIWLAKLADQVLDKPEKTLALIRALMENFPRWWSAATSVAPRFFTRYARLIAKLVASLDAEIRVDDLNGSLTQLVFALSNELSDASSVTSFVLDGVRIMKPDAAHLFEATTEMVQGLYVRLIDRSACLDDWCESGVLLTIFRYLCDFKPHNAVPNDPCVPVAATSTAAANYLVTASSNVSALSCAAQERRASFSLMHFLSTIVLNVDSRSTLDALVDLVVTKLCDADVSNLEPSDMERMQQIVCSWLELNSVFTELFVGRALQILSTTEHEPPIDDYEETVDMTSSIEVLDVHFTDSEKSRICEPVSVENTAKSHAGFQTKDAETEDDEGDVDDTMNHPRYTLRKVLGTVSSSASTESPSSTEDPFLKDLMSLKWLKTSYQSPAKTSKSKTLLSLLSASVAGASSRSSSQHDAMVGGGAGSAHQQQHATGSDGSASTKPACELRYPHGSSVARIRLQVPALETITKKYVALANPARSLDLSTVSLVFAGQDRMSGHVLPYHVSLEVGESLSSMVVVATASLDPSRSGGVNLSPGSNVGVTLTPINSTQPIALASKSYMILNVQLAATPELSTTMFKKGDRVIRCAPSHTDYALFQDGNDVKDPNTNPVGMMSGIVEAVIPENGWIKVIWHTSQVEVYPPDQLVLAAPHLCEARVTHASSYLTSSAAHAHVDSSNTETASASLLNRHRIQVVGMLKMSVIGIRRKRRTSKQLTSTLFHLLTIALAKRRAEVTSWIRADEVSVTVAFLEFSLDKAIRAQNLELVWILAQRSQVNFAQLLDSALKRLSGAMEAKELKRRDRDDPFGSHGAIGFARDVNVLVAFIVRCVCYSSPPQSHAVLALLEVFSRSVIDCSAPLHAGHLAVLWGLSVIFEQRAHSKRREPDVEVELDGERLLSFVRRLRVCIPDSPAERGMVRFLCSFARCESARVAKVFEQALAQPTEFVVDLATWTLVIGSLEEDVLVDLLARTNLLAKLFGMAVDGIQRNDAPYTLVILDGFATLCDMSAHIRSQMSTTGTLLDLLELVDRAYNPRPVMATRLLRVSAAPGGELPEPGAAAEPPTEGAASDGPQPGEGDDASAATAEAGGSSAASSSNYATATTMAATQVGFSGVVGRACAVVAIAAMNRHPANQETVARFLAQGLSDVNDKQRWFRLDLLSRVAFHVDKVAVFAWSLELALARLLEGSDPSLMPNMERRPPTSTTTHSTSLTSVSSRGLNRTPFSFDAEACGACIQLSSSSAAGGAAGPAPLNVATQVVLEKWGLVRCINELPNTGVSTWEVRIDSCLKGHIFIGVATDQAPLDNYLGADKHGFGYIGNRAVWSNKQKMRAYGKDFRTGDVLKCIYDGSAGTLSFCVGSEELGVAFTGLTGMRLFPAFALYQKGDAVTLLSASVPASAGHAASTAVAMAMSGSKLACGASRQRCAMLHDHGSNTSTTRPPRDEPLASLMFARACPATPVTVDAAAEDTFAVVAREALKGYVPSDAANVLAEGGEWRVDVELRAEESVQLGDTVGALASKQAGPTSTALNIELALKRRADDDQVVERS